MKIKTHQEQINSNHSIIKRTIFSVYSFFLVFAICTFFDGISHIITVENVLLGIPQKNVAQSDKKVSFTVCAFQQFQRFPNDYVIAPYHHKQYHNTYYRSTEKKFHASSINMKSKF